MQQNTITQNKKRVRINSDTFNRIYNDFRSKILTQFNTKNELVGEAIEALYKECIELKKQEHVNLDDDTKKKIDFVINMGIATNMDEVVKDAVQLYLETKKEELKKMVDSL